MLHPPTPRQKVCVHKDAETEKLLKAVGWQVVRFAGLDTAEQGGQFLREYQSAVENPCSENQ